MLFRTVIFVYLLIFAAVFGWPQSKSESGALTVKEMNISGSELSDRFIRRLITFKEGDEMTEEELIEAIGKSRVLAQNDENIYLIEFEYAVEGSEVFVEVIVYDATVKLSFSAFLTGPIIRYRNLLGEGVDLGTHLGFSRQMVELDWKRVAQAPIGVSLLAGHQIVNPFESEYRTFSLGSTNRLYVWLGRHVNLGILNDVYRNLGGWDKAKGVTSLGLGSFLRMDYLYLIDLIDVGFTMDAEYLYYIRDLTNAHKVNLRGKVFIRPFNTGKVAFGIDSRLHWASGELVSRGSNSFSHGSGRTAWELGLYIPVQLVTISGGANYYLGLEPGVVIGRIGAENLEFANPNVGVSLAPVFQVGFPVSIFVSARFIYNISEQRLAFNLNFSTMPYTKELDMNW